MALISGTPESVGVHLKVAANIDRRDRMGDTALMIAAARGRTDICRLLLSKGADPTLINATGKTALGLAEARGHAETARLLSPAGPTSASAQSATVQLPTTVEIDAEVGAGVPDLRACAASTRPIGEIGEPVEEHCDFTPNDQGRPTEPAAHPGAVVPQFGVDNLDSREEENRPAKSETLYADTIAPLLEIILHDIPGVADAGGGALWIAEPDAVVPVHDLEALAQAAELQLEIARHRALDTDEDWSDVLIDLPLPRRRIVRDPAYAKQNDLFRKLLTAGLLEMAVAEAEVRNLFLPPGPTVSDLDLRRFAAAKATLEDLGIRIDESADWFTVSEISPAAMLSEVEDAELFFESLWTAEDVLDPFYREVNRNGSLKRAEEMRLWSSFRTGARHLCEILIEIPRIHFSLVEEFSRQLRTSPKGSSSSPTEDVDDEDDAVVETSPTSHVTARIGSDEGSPASLYEMLDEIRETDPFSPRRREILTAVLADITLPWDALERLYEEIIDADFNNTVNIKLSRMIQSTRRARNRLIACYQPLVVWIARRHQNRGIALSDLIQEGSIGLIKAVDRFDVGRGYLFSTYATWWVRQSITRSVHDFSRTIRIPVHLAESLYRLSRATTSFENRNERKPTAEELATILGRTVQQIATLQNVQNELVSFEDIEGELTDGSSQGAFEMVAERDLKLAASGWLLGLTPREERVLRLRFGIGMLTEQTLEEVGSGFEVTRERIRQIEAKALRRLRHPARSRQLQQFLGD